VKIPFLKRRFLVTLGVLGVAYGSFGLFSRKPTSDKAEAKLVFFDKMHQKVIDTVIPADTFVGALDLAVDKKVFTLILNKQTFKRNLLYLYESIDEMAIRSENQVFNSLSQDKREKLLIDILGSNELKHKQARALLVHLRALVMRSYYNSSTGQKSLSYVSPNIYPTY